MFSTGVAAYSSAWSCKVFPHRSNGYILQGAEGRNTSSDESFQLFRISRESSWQCVLSSQVICGERLQGLVSDGALYYKPVPHRGTAKSTIGTVKGKAYKLKLYWYKLCALQVFRIAYCDFFDPAEADTLHQICVGFVHTVRDFMPSLLRKQKVHYFLHLVESMQDYGPTSAFSAERYICTSVCVCVCVCVVWRDGCLVCVCVWCVREDCVWLFGCVCVVCVREDCVWLFGCELFVCVCVCFVYFSVCVPVCV